MEERDPQPRATTGGASRLTAHRRRDPGVPRVAEPPPCRRSGWQRLLGWLGRLFAWRHLSVRIWRS